MHTLCVKNFRRLSSRRPRRANHAQDICYKRAKLLKKRQVASCVLDFLLLAQRYRPQDYRVPGQFGFPKEGSCEGFVKIGKVPVRLTRIIPGREGFLEAARLYKEERCSSESR